MGRDGSEVDETSIRGAWSAGDIDGAVSAALRAYGAEVYGFLVALHSDEDAADDAFSLFTERLWRSFGGFEWRCSVRTWAYLLARNASATLRRGEARHARHEVPLESMPEVEQLAARIRTETLTALRTENKGALQRMRDELPEEDRMLLVLRVDRQLAWREVACVLSPDGDAFDEAKLAQESARLRKRFQLVRDRLHALGKERGLV